MIIPAILEQSIEEVQKKIDRVNGFVDCVQIDIIDEGQTITLGALREINFYHLAVDVHLMTDVPETFLEQCVEIARKTDRHSLDRPGIAMTSRIRVIGQIERMEDQRRFLLTAHSLQLTAGLGLDLYTPISSLDPNAKAEADCILLMSVKAGFSGQHFDDRVIEKINELRNVSYKGPIVIDGGLDISHIRTCTTAGANEFAVGSFLWEHQHIENALSKLQTA